jgi:hypothetical protein
MVSSLIWEPRTLEASLACRLSKRAGAMDAPVQVKLFVYGAGNRVIEKVPLVTGVLMPLVVSVSTTFE